MGQKIHPGGLRVGVIHDWKSNWYAGKKEVSAYILEDVRIREHIYKKLAHAGLSDILIRKDKQRITVDIYTARPGIVIGKSGVEVDALRKKLHALTQKNVHININEIKRPELDAKLVAQSIAEQLSNRVAFRRAMKRALASAIRSGAAGVKIQCSGRLGGGEMSRRETYNEGRVPLHTIRADIDYGFVEARTTAGRIGVKVWINKGEIMPEGFGDQGTGADSRLGDQDARRRRGGATEGLGASRESGRGRGQDREGLGPVRQRRRGQGGGPGGGGPGGPGGGGRGGRPGQRRGQGPSGARPSGGPGQGARPAGGGGGRPQGGQQQGGGRPQGGQQQGGGGRSQGGGRPQGGQQQGGQQSNRPGSNRPGGGDRARGQDNVEKPRTDESARSAEGREQPVIEPKTEPTPKPVADAPDSTPPKQVEDPTKPDQSGDTGSDAAGQEKTS
jgi:small subunit ribosomal protein S3